MADVIELVPNSVKVDDHATDWTWTMDLEEAVDVSGYSRLDLQLEVVSGTLAAIEVISSMTRSKVDAVWVSAASKTSNSAEGGHALKVPGTDGVLLRYIRVRARASSAPAVIRLTGLARL